MILSDPIEGVVFIRLFTFSPPTRSSQISEQKAIDDGPKPMPSLLNYPPKRATDHREYHKIKSVISMKIWIKCKRIEIVFLPLRTSIIYLICNKAILNRLSYSPFRGVARGGGAGGPEPPEFGRSVNLIKTKGGRLCPSHYCQPPGFKQLSTPLLFI